ncbi:phenylacetate-CoA oxygenase subunit PaaI [Halogeometricum sp. S1BR25-6]|uniref:Phenylacetate-CoA oxygenase subunit PaaI n=1 Tax=Halogeometricum salsisoli TaxID=2950536 RepID=A0ABU2GIA5_9EURY|nr:Phenylacetic acid catabolic protein [Halogeometricum sp. S1BR25-6]MDS0300532.1 phenylacetate-CoA oxygenase subunit PaaI [Halogeometricum sp. S1BR25-6]
MSKWSDEAVNYVQAIADTKLVLSQRYAEWMFSGPVLEDDIAGASAAQDELGHVRQLFRLLGQQGRADDWLEGDRTAAEFSNAATIDERPGSWVEFVVRIGLTERAAWYLIDAIDHEDFEGLGTRIGQDEYFHLEFLDGRLETMGDERTDQVTAALESALPDVLAFLGPAAYDDETDPLVASGFTDRSASALRAAFVDRLEEIFGGTAVDVDALDVNWDAPDVEEWDERRRRTGDGTISEGDVESLSGVQNAEFRME